MSSQGTGRIALLPEHLYVHVPLCRSKCSYCDFYSVGPEALGETPAFLAELLADQAVAWLDRGAEPRRLATVYVGGGTPTMLGRSLPMLVGGIVAAFGLREDAEVTVEANPESVTRLLLAALAEVGVTRVSLGVQSFDDEALALLGRVHDAESAASAAADVIGAGLSLSVDLMCGIPGVGADAWEQDIKRAVATGADHVSVYPLSLEAGTPLAAAAVVGDVPEPDPDETAEQMVRASEMLAAAGLLRYEVANYARPGFESRHNTAYWTGREYLGVGPSAHGMLDARTARACGFAGLGDDVERIRYAIAADLDEGTSRAPRVDVEALTRAEALREDAMLGLRLARGIDDALAADANVIGALASLEADGLVERGGAGWRVTQRGWLLGNEVFGRVWGNGV